MILFLTSLLLVLLSSYFISAMLDNKNFASGFIYFLVCAFAQIILTTELLSLFKMFKEIPFLTLNLLFCATIAVIWIKKGCPYWHVHIKNFLTKVKNALMLDNSLFVLILAWLFFIAVSFFLCAITTVTDGDAKSYHVARSAFWVLNSTINHYPSIDIRALIFPINSEIVYSWVILFTKNVLFLGFLSFAFYFVYITSLYKILNNLMGYSLRRTLWVLFIVSSLAGIMVQSASVQTDLIVASLIMASIYLFWSSLKDKTIIPLIMSSLCFALALGTKSSSGFLVLAVGIFFVYLSYKYKNYKNLLEFIGFGAVNFLIFSAYNYVLNYLEFKNIFGFHGALISHQNIYGIKGFCANLIKHTWLLFDFSGVNWENPVGEFILHTKQNLLTALNLQGVPDGVYSPTKYQNVLNNTLAESLTGCGLLGFILFLPCLIISLVKPIFKRNKKIILNMFFAILFVVAFVTMSASIVYMVFNVRFINCFIFISAPIFALSYIKNNKNIFKWLIISIACFYFVAVSTHIWSRPFNKIFSAFIKNPTKISELQNAMDCINWDSKEPNNDETCRMQALIEYNFNDKNNKIVFFPNSPEPILRFLLMNLRGYNIDIKSIEDTAQEDFDKYNIIIAPNNWQYLNFYKTPITESKNKNYNCMYRRVDYKIVPPNLANDYTYTSLCKFTETFSEKYKFEEVTSFDDITEKMRYVFYVNRRNLPHTNRIN